MSRIEAINISKEKGVPKTQVAEADITELGISGDAHAGRWHRQVSVLSKESVDSFAKKTGMAIDNGAFAENILISGIDLSTAAILDRIKLGEVILEVTQIGKECHGHTCTISKRTGECIMPKEGVFTRVIEAGRIKTGDHVQLMHRSFNLHIITVSDRASAGEYEDLSGPKIKEIVQSHFKNSRLHIEIDSTLIPDEAQILKQVLLTDRDSFTDVVIITGGTGIGPRDVTPEVVFEIADRVIPGIMESVRAKFGVANPKAYLSRSIAAVADQTIIYALPGSVKAVEEYMAEILKTMEHLFEMLHGIGH